MTEQMEGRRGKKDPEGRKDRGGEAEGQGQGVTEKEERAGRGKKMEGTEKRRSREAQRGGKDRGGEAEGYGQRITLRSCCSVPQHHMVSL